MDNHTPQAWAFIPVEAVPPESQPNELPGYVVRSDRGAEAAVDGLALMFAALGAALLLAALVVL